MTSSSCARSASTCPAKSSRKSPSSVPSLEPAARQVAAGRRQGEVVVEVDGEELAAEHALSMPRIASNPTSVQSWFPSNNRGYAFRGVRGPPQQAVRRPLRRHRRSDRKYAAGRAEAPVAEARRARLREARELQPDRLRQGPCC